MVVEFLKNQEPIRKPTSPWMPIPTLIGVLSKFLPQPSIDLILKYHKSHRVRTYSPIPIALISIIVLSVFNMFDHCPHLL